MKKNSIRNAPFVWEIHFRCISPSFSSMQCLLWPQDGMTPLFNATMCGSADFVEKLIKADKLWNQSGWSCMPIFMTTNQRVCKPWLLPPYRLVPSQTWSPQSISWRPMNGYQFPWQQSVVIYYYLYIYIRYHIISECNPFLVIGSLYRWESSFALLKHETSWNRRSYQAPKAKVKYEEERDRRLNDFDQAIRWGDSSAVAASHSGQWFCWINTTKEISWETSNVSELRMIICPHRILHDASHITSQVKFHITSHRTSDIISYQMTPQHTTSHTSHHIRHITNARSSVTKSHTPDFLSIALIEVTTWSTTLS